MDLVNNSGIIYRNGIQHILLTGKELLLGHKKFESFGQTVYYKAAKFNRREKRKTFKALKRGERRSSGAKSLFPRVG
jgi:hypothetical protein